MSGLRRALHIRTGQRAAADAVDAWLVRHGLAVAVFDDVYDACVHLLEEYAQIPELALLGADWLAPGDLQIIRYIRDTWPRTGVIVYGGSQDTPAVDLLPLTMACRSEAALAQLLVETPSDVVRRLAADAPQALPVVPARELRLPGRRMPRATPEVLERAEAARPEERTDGDHKELGGSERSEVVRPLPGDARRPALTSQELAALLGEGGDN